MPEPGGKRRWIGAGLALLLVGALVAHATLVGVVPGTDKNAATSSQEDAFGQGAGVDAYIREIGLIADGASQSMADASAGASASADSEVQAAADAAAQAVAQASAQGDAALTSAERATGGVLATPPTGYQPGDHVAAPPVSVPSYKTPQPEWSITCHGCLVAQWTNDSKEYKVRAGINDSPTGSDDIDGGFSVLAEVWLTIKNEIDGSIAANNNVTIVNGAIGTVTSDGENVTYMPKPDEEGAAAAEAHAEMVLNNSQAVLTDTLSGLQAKVALEGELVAQVSAEINETMEAAAEAEAEIDATAQQRVEAEYKKAAEAEREFDAQADAKISAVREAQVSAKQQVRAEAEQRVEVLFETATAQSEQLEAQAQQTLEAAAEAVARIRAQEQAALAAAYSAQNATGEDLSAEISAIQSAAAAAEAAVMGRAEQQSELLLTQSAAMQAAAEARAEAVLGAAAEAEAQIDARAEVAVEATLKAAAYAKARVRAEAEARADAHIAVAQSAKALVKAQAKQHVRAVLDAAFALHFQMKAEFDGSRPLSQMVAADTDHAVSKDVDYIAEVQQDYERQQALDRDGRAEHWENVTYDLTSEKEVVLDTASDIDYFVGENADVFVGTFQGLEALGQQWL